MVLKVNTLLVTFIAKKHIWLTAKKVEMASTMRLDSIVTVFLWTIASYSYMHNNNNY